MMKVDPDPIGLFATRQEATDAILNGLENTPALGLLAKKHGFTLTVKEAPRGGGDRRTWFGVYLVLKEDRHLRSVPNP